ncbi:Zinc finger CCCH domain-containing protein 14 [Smittium mucronatum]|uniref:Zinc finger CCCH domain-containing protein 14 n=1 Tax=Smittium mucronatum TaxID=133383 RepID=A0A1R0H8E1_9FUNG|nr:Zinc finger CCCH domain-containing protein 14 [Smittium mucronatum]
MNEEGLAHFQNVVHRKLVEVNYSSENVLGDAYNPEFGVWVEQESKDRIYYPDGQTSQIQIEESIPIDPTPTPQSAFSQQLISPQPTDNEDVRMRSTSKTPADANNRLFMNAIESSNSDRNSIAPHQNHSDRYKKRDNPDRSSSRSKKDHSASDRLKSSNSRNGNVLRNTSSRSSRSPIKEISIKSSRRSNNSNSEILSRLGKSGNSSNKIEKNSQQKNSPLQAKIKGIADDSGANRSHKKSVLSRLGSRVSPDLTSNASDLDPLSQRANFLKQSLQMGLDSNNQNSAQFGYPHNNNFHSTNNNLPENLYGLKRTKCSKWPLCESGSDCPYFHPTKACPDFPNCPLPAKECMYIHPAVGTPGLENLTSHNLTLKNTPSAKLNASSQILCKYGINCTNPTCGFAHPDGKLSSTTPLNPNPLDKSAILCKFYPNCMNTRCPFLHPDPNQVSAQPFPPSSFNKTLINNPAAAPVPVANPTGLQSELASADPNSGKLPGSLCDPAKKVPFPCRDGENCPRLDCHFVHPHESSAEALPCKFGHYCTRPNCMYSHPTRNKSLIIDNSGTNPVVLTSTTSGIENRLDHISERPFAAPQVTEVSMANDDADNNQIGVIQSQPNNLFGNNQSGSENGISNSGIQSHLQKQSQLLLDSSLNSQIDHTDDVVMNL